jgi:hypothetical protein
MPTSIAPVTYKMREGTVGGYARHFGEEDLKYLNDAVRGRWMRFEGVRCEGRGDLVSDTF